MRDKVFISYSRTDKKWLEQLKTWLKQFVREDKISIWDDSKIAPGEDWREEIRRALDSTRVAVLLVSQDFLASDFIQADELPPLLEAAKKDEAKILWMAVRPCMYQDTVISRHQALNEPSKPLSTLKVPDQEKTLVRICEHIKATVNVVQVQSRYKPTKSKASKAASTAIKGGALKPTSAGRTSNVPQSGTEHLFDQLPSVSPVVTTHTSSKPLSPVPGAENEQEPEQCNRKGNNFVLTFDRESIPAEYSDVRDGTLKLLERATSPITVDPLHADLLGIFDDWLYRGTITRQLEMQVFGSLLYQTLFAGNVRELFEEALYRTSKYDLRLRLRFVQNPLERLPWEFLRKPDSLSRPGLFLAISHRLTLTRYQPSPIIHQGRASEDRPRILLVVSNPQDRLPILGQESIDRLQNVSIDTLQNVAHDHSLEESVLLSPTPTNFLERLETYRPHVVHVIAHARTEETGISSIAFMTEDHQACWIRGTYFSELFRDSNVSVIILQKEEVGYGDQIRTTFVRDLMDVQVGHVVELRYSIPNAIAAMLERCTRLLQQGNHSMSPFNAHGVI